MRALAKSLGKRNAGRPELALAPFRARRLRLVRMGDITSKKLLIVKGGLFVALGLLASGVILLLYPDLRLALLLAVAVWAFCRAYYFAFYVVQHYIDPEFRFAGLGSVLAYLWRRRSRPPGDVASRDTL